MPISPRVFQLPARLALSRVEWSFDTEISPLVAPLGPDTFREGAGVQAGPGTSFPRIHTMSRWPSATNFHLPLTHLPSQPTQSLLDMFLRELEAHSRTLIWADNKKPSSCKEKVESQCKMHHPGHKAFLRWVRSGSFS